jgi:uncharacterized protein (DUF983 family)
MNTERWQPKDEVGGNPWPMPKLATAVGRGLRGRCPGCGEGRVFRAFLKVVPECEHCGAPLGLARADDAPPYFTILIVGHIVVPLLFMADRAGTTPLWIMWSIFPLLTLALAVALIQPIKGGTVGLMLNLNMLKSDPTAT